MKRFVIALFLVFTFLIRPAQALAVESSISATPTVIQSPELTSLALFLQGIGQALVGSGPKSPGVVTFLASTMDLMFSHPPASSVDYIAYMGSRLHFPGAPTPVYAQGEGGYGYNALRPILPIWTVMRNIAYLAFAVVFIVIGFMIIFRVKIDPKTVTSIQNALPKMIFALLLVTFSYAIAGFLIDLMYLAIHLVVIIVMAAIPSQAGKTLAQAYGDYVISPGSFILGLPNALLALASGGNAAWALAAASVKFFTSTDVILFSSIIGGILGSIITPGIGTLIGVAAGPFVGIVGGPIIMLTLVFFIIILMILWALAKIWLMLLNAYANIILGIIFSPVYLMLEAIPGQSQFWNWMRGMLANLLAFPAVIGMLMLAFLMSSWGAQEAVFSWSGGKFVPPLIGGNDPGAIQAIVGLAILLTTPKVVEILQEWFKVPPFKYGGAWMESFNAPKWAASTVLERRAQQRQIDMNYLKNTTPRRPPGVETWQEQYSRMEGAQNVENMIGGLVGGVGGKGKR